MQILKLIYRIMRLGRLVRISFCTIISTVLTMPALGDILDLGQDTPLLSDLSPLLKAGDNDYLVDAEFGSIIKRLSVAHNTRDNADSGSLPFIANEYSTVTPFNADNSRLLLQHFSYFALYDGNGNYINDIPYAEIKADSEPRWSVTDPDVFYYYYRNSIKQFNVKTWKSRLVQEFPEYTRISGRGESDMSYDGNHLVLIGDDRDIFVYTLSTKTKQNPLNITGLPTDIDNLQITPDNNVIVGWLEDGIVPYRGYALYDINMNYLRQLTNVLGHMDVTRDKNGDEIMLWVNAAEALPPPIPGCENAVVKIRLIDAKRSCMIAFDWGINVHISAPDAGSWFLVSTYGSRNVKGLKYQDQVLGIKFDGSLARHLVHHGSRAYENYRFQPKASVSRDGRKVVYSSNYGLQESQGYPAQYTDAFLIQDATASPITPIDVSPDRDKDKPGQGSNGSTGGSGGSRPGGGIVAGNPFGNGPDPVDTKSCEIQLRDLDMEAFNRVEEDHPDVHFVGDWQTFSHPQMSAQRTRASNIFDTEVSFDFEGTVVVWVGYIGPLGGTADIFIDQDFLLSVDTDYDNHVPQNRIVIIGNLEPGFHSLSLVVPEQDGLGTRGVWVDAFEVIDSSQGPTACIPGITAPEVIVSQELAKSA